MKLYNKVDKVIGDMELDFPYDETIDYIQHKINIGMCMINYPLAIYGIEGSFRVDFLHDSVRLIGSDKPPIPEDMTFVKEDIEILEDDGRRKSIHTGAEFKQLSIDSCYDPSTDFAKILHDCDEQGCKIMLKEYSTVFLPMDEYPDDDAE